MSASNIELSPPIRNLLVIFGDQLSHQAHTFDDFDNDKDAVLMMEVRNEAEYIPQHKIRLVLFFSAMRHFRDELRSKGRRVVYVELNDHLNRQSFGEEIARWMHKLHPDKIVITEAGDYRVESALKALAEAEAVPLEIFPDNHFLCSREEFAAFADGRKSLLMEAFYRDMRKKHHILMRGDEPEGGEWNYDKDNRESFGKDGPPRIKAPRAFRPDDITQEVIQLVESEFADAPGRLEHFDYPVTHKQAREALRDFIEHRLKNFGQYQDAMATGHPYLYHSRLTCVMNLHLLDPADVIDAAVKAYDEGKAPLNSVEGFVRQVLGWREYIHGIYWLEMPGFARRNALRADQEMPGFMWTGKTRMNCVKQSVLQLVDHAYAHHIQRLMVLGLYSLLLGVHPHKVHEWHMSVYADAIDWVSLPNVIGMSQYGDGGYLATKPYCASGNYINKMSDYCKDCEFHPKKATGEEACPITVLYWDFLARHEAALTDNHRMKFQINNLRRKDKDELVEIRKLAAELRQNPV